ncbi:MAG: branched-chain amino acid ABC transporter permease [Burkholderiales bacterium]|nr:branched-chain amino acid ABC transporter permease [Burkholderiales bacterium]
MLYRENGQFKTSYSADSQILPIRQDRIAMALLLTAAFIVIPIVSSEYLLRAIFIPFLILSLAALGLNVLVGYCGQISLGSGAFMAVGASSGSVSVAGLSIAGVSVESPASRYLLCLAFVVVFALATKNLVRGHIGRSWMAMRDMDVAAAVIGIRPMQAKLSAFAVSSFIIGVAGALWGFVHLGSWEPAAFGINRSFDLLFMVIIGGLGSISGAFFGAAFIVVLPLLLDKLPYWTGLPMDTATASHLALMIFGALIVFFLIKEPHGLARLWATAKEKLRLWPFPH